jgi:hypothetical protein
VDAATTAGPLKASFKLVGALKISAVFFQSCADLIKSNRSEQLMDPKDFVSGQREYIVKTPTGYWAFIPPPLPPALAYDTALALLLSHADAALSELLARSP